jgi:hypothetical protein
MRNSITLTGDLLTFALATVFSLPPYPGTFAIYERILGYLENPRAALLVMELVVEIVDKTFCIVLAAIAATFFAGFSGVKWRKTRKKRPDPDQDFYNRFR